MTAPVPTMATCIPKQTFELFCTPIQFPFRTKCLHAQP